MIDLYKSLIYFCAMLMIIVSTAWAQEQKDVSMVTEGKFQNRLIHEKSPYLLQHADNPVDWFPWGDEAFEEARKQDKPIFLSIGYSTCHWCHVMEHESFENPAVAALMNKYFISIKVDREERPDIDNIYMSAVMAMTGRGGWPLTALLTHDKKPFFGGTYFPPNAKWGSPGLIDLINSVHDTWVNRREELIQSSNSLTEILIERADKNTSRFSINSETMSSAYQQFEQLYDKHYGGFGKEPKFPSSHNLSFLLRYWKRYKEPKALEMVEHTLNQMANGGMYDHIGGGFHRYATDQLWQIPHFEKMLYDQAILARTYLEAYQITKNEYFAQVAREIFDYVIREMQSDLDGFYSAEDADSLDPDEYSGISIDSSQSHEKKEGAFYLWRHKELIDHLDENSAQIFNYHFGIGKNGNAHSDPHNEFTHKNIIFVEHSIKETAKHFGESIEDINKILMDAKAKLYSIRNDRPHPYLDDKVLADWNGLMISSLSFGARVLNEPKYQEAAEQAAQFILANMLNKEGRLLHRYRDGESAIDGTIEDYAFFIYGLLDLYEATFNIEYLEQSISLSEQMVQLFWDNKDGGFYFTANDAKKLLFRQKEIYDGAIPSGNSIAAHNLVRLARITFDSKWEEKYDILFKLFAESIVSNPSSYAQMLIAFDFAIGPSAEIVISVPSAETNVDNIVQAVYNRFLPNKVILYRPAEGNEAESLLKISPFVEHQLPLDSQTTIYLCENHVCKLPVRKLDKLENLLDQILATK